MQPTEPTARIIRSHTEAVKVAIRFVKSCNVYYAELSEQAQDEFTRLQLLANELKRAVDDVVLD